jgi:hypothetical protein
MTSSQQILLLDSSIFGRISGRGNGYLASAARRLSFSIPIDNSKEMCRKPNCAQLTKTFPRKSATTSTCITTALTCWRIRACLSQIRLRALKRDPERCRQLRSQCAVPPPQILVRLQLLVFQGCPYQLRDRDFISGLYFGEGKLIVHQATISVVVLDATAHPVIDPVTETRAVTILLCRREDNSQGSIMTRSIFLPLEIWTPTPFGSTVKKLVGGLPLGCGFRPRRFSSASTVGASQLSSWKATWSI